MADRNDQLGWNASINVAGLSDLVGSANQRRLRHGQGRRQHIL